LLLSAGSQFTEELWYILCLGIKKIVNSTLTQTRQLIDCFQQGSNSVTGDNGYTVKIVARRDVTPTESLRALQLAEQVNIIFKYLLHKKKYMKFWQALKFQNFKKKV